MQADTERLLMRFLDGELGGEEEEQALRRIAGDPDARALLRFDARLRAVLGEDRPPAAGSSMPPGFTDRVMRAIEAREAAGSPAGAIARSPAGNGRDVPETARNSGVLSRLRGWWGRPRTLVWRPAHALAAAAVVVLATLGAATLLDLTVDSRAGSGTEAGGADGPLATRAEGLEGTRVSGTAGDTVLVRFVFEEPSAQTVAVAGDFSRWEPIELQPRWRDGRRVWTGVVAVPRGEHRYMFVVDGSEWVTDPLAPAVGDDGFGGRNAILSL